MVKMVVVMLVVVLKSQFNDSETKKREGLPLEFIYRT